MSEALGDSNTLPQSSRGFSGKTLSYFKNCENILRLKLDCFLLLWAFIAGLMKEMDQSATTQAYVSGMKEDLKLDGNELVWFTTYFSIAYAIFIVPAQLIQMKVRPSLFLPLCEVSWGILTLFTFRAKSAKTVYILRFFLGMFSATSWPGIVALIFNWYTPAELALRLAVFNMSDVAGAMFLGVVQAELYKNLNGVHGLAGWQWLFIVSGVLTIALGLIGLVVVPDSPAITRAIWLTQEERELSRERMSRFGTSTSKIIPLAILRSKLRQIVIHPITYLYLAAFALAAWSHRANSYFLLYLKGVTNLKTGKPLYSTYHINIIPLGGYALSIVSSVALNALSDRKHWRWQINIGTGIIHLIACSVLTGWPPSHAVIMTFYFLTYTTGAGSPALMAWLAEILKKEPEARAIIVALTVMIVYVGHATIPLRAWKVTDSPRYPIGFPLSVAFISGSMFAVLAMRWYVETNSQVLESGYGQGSVTVVENTDSIQETDSSDLEEAALPSAGKRVAPETPMGLPDSLLR